MMGFAVYMLICLTLFGVFRAVTTRQAKQIEGQVPDRIVPMNQEHFAALKELDAITPEAPPIAPDGPPRTPQFPSEVYGGLIATRPPRPRLIWIPAAKTFDQALDEATAALRLVGTRKTPEPQLTAQKELDYLSVGFIGADAVRRSLLADGAVTACDGSCEGSARLHTLFGHAGAPPVAPPVSPEEIARRLSARWLEAVQGPSGWQVAKIEIEAELFVASLGPVGACTNLSIKVLVEQNTNGVKFVCAPSRT